MSIQPLDHPTHTNTWSLTGATIIVPDDAPEMVRFAGRELSRYLYQLTGTVSPLCGTLPSDGTAVVLEATPATCLGESLETERIGEQGYRLATVRSGQAKCVTISALTPVGVLYGVYGLLEELGMGFYAGGDTFPELPSAALLPATLNQYAKPAFTVRGNMLHYNFLCGCTDWGLADYKFYFDQLAHMRCNMLLIHWYDGEPGAAYEVDGEYLAGAITPNSLTRPWGAIDALRTSEFSFGTGRLFDEEIYSSPAGEDLPDLLTEVKRSEEMFRAATSYARSLGVGIAAGFEGPRGDPTDPTEVANFRARVQQFLQRNPDISHFALWQYESGGCYAADPPAPGTPAAGLLESQRAQFAYLGNERRVWEAIRHGRFAQIAVEVTAEVAPGLPVVLVGWGGDRWMRFADYCLGYDKMLPANVIFTCHDNIDASMGPNVSTPWGELPPARERWAMPWVEGDIDDCMVRQPHVESLGKLAPDALQKGCQGLLTLQWRTRDVEEETGFIARYAWNTALNPDGFYHELARHAFGPDQEQRLGAHLGTLQRLGARWTGVRGCAECSAMQWTGWTPHYPFELDEKVVPHLLPKAEAAVKAFAEIPAVMAGAEAGAFHLRTEEDGAAARTDTTRLGVREMSEVVERLRTLAAERDPERIRTELIAIEEVVYALRAPLLAFGMSSPSYHAIDGFLIAIHHLQRNAGVKQHMATVRAIRGDLAALREQYLAEGRIARLERLDYLLATMDFVLPYDSAVVLLADGEEIDQALAQAAQAKEAGDAAAAAQVAANAYALLLDAGMQQAIDAFARKLTTRCDFGTMTTLNVKPLPLYWRTIARLDEYLPATPPREICARGRRTEVWLSWRPGKNAGQQLYRRPVAGGEWQCVTARTLSAHCHMFIDRPMQPGSYEYAVTSLDGNGWESPRSHTAQATCGPLSAGPQLVACKPFARQAAGEAFTLRMVAISARDVASVVLRYRQAGETVWCALPMAHRFRDSYTVTVPGSAMQPGVVEFFVEAIDNDGNRSTWPQAAAQGLPWTLTVAK